ncbi:MAG: von Willebrand factor type A domain-containing protein [Opitutus sp.]
MNHSEETNPSGAIPAEMEARIVAAVVGEASAFELAELERLLAEQPELRTFKQQIEATHAVVQHAERSERAPMRLAPERRAKILAAFGVPAEVSPDEANEAVILKFAAARRRRRKTWAWTSGLAASLTLASVLALRVLPSSQPMMVREVQSAREESDFVRAEGRLSMEKKKREASPLIVEKENVEAEPTDGPTNQPAPPAAAMALSSSDTLAKPKIEMPRQLPVRVAEVQEGNRRLYGAVRIPPKKPLLFGDQMKRIEPQAGGGKLLDAVSPTGANGESRTVGGVVKPIDKSWGVTADEETIALSPFEVSASRDQGGYMASNSIAGSRVRTELKDLGKDLDFGKKQTFAYIVATAAADDFLTGGKTVAPATPAESSLSELKTTAATVDEKLSNLKADQREPQSAAAVDNRAEINTRTEPVSTFSLHVSDASFRIAQAALARGERPDPATIRPEEFYNAFDYGDPSPAAAERVGCRVEQSGHPFMQQRNLVRIAMKVPSSGRSATQALHLTVLLDTSGSMERADRVATVHRALEVLASLLTANDRVTLIGFARQPHLLAENVAGDQASQLVELASHTPFEGGTNLEEALKLAGELAQRHQDAAAQNRIVFITDGAANLGNANPQALATTIEQLRQQGISFDACGVGTDGLDDTVLEALTRKGDGRYTVLDQASDADAGFAQQLAGAFRPAAENVKVQVRFNPARVGSYRLIGFEQHRLKEEDFRNDKVDAAELAADEAAVALYQIEVLPEGEGELGEVFVRFRDPATKTMIERSWPMLHDPQARAFDRSTPTLQLAGTAAFLAEKLRGGELANLIRLDDLAPTVNSLRGHYANSARVQQLVQMFEQMRRQSGP